MTTLVRRRHPRITLRIVAYMDIEPGNGAIVLNVSREGLCFQAVSPLPPDHPVHFSFKEGNRHMAGSGELVWLDDRNKCGGLRFTELSLEARSQVDQWLARASSDDQQAAKRTLDSMSVEHSTRRPESSSNTQVVALRLPVPRRAPATLKLTLKGGRFPALISCALFASVVLGSLIFLGYAHRRELGESIGHIGRPLAWQSVPESSSLNPAPQSLQTTPNATTVAPAVLPTAVSKSSDPADESQEAPEAEVTIRHFAPEHPTASKPADARSLVSRDNPANPPAELADAQQLALVASPPVLSRPPLSALPSTSNELPTHALVIAGSTPVNDSTVHMYLDVGRFKDELIARDVRDKVASLGLRSTVLKSRSIWKTSYQVLVGPYGDQDEQTTAEADLLSHGYKPRPFERGSRGFVFRSRLDLNGTQLPVGDSYTISWESYVESASVRFAQRDGVVATARGRWVERTEKFSQDEYVYVRNGASKTLIEIHFAGLKRALVFGGSS